MSKELSPLDIDTMSNYRSVQKPGQYKMAAYIMLKEPAWKFVLARDLSTQILDTLKFWDFTIERIEIGHPIIFRILNSSMVLYMIRVFCA